MKPPCGGDAFSPAQQGMRKPTLYGPAWPDICKYCAKKQPKGKCGEIPIGPAGMTEDEVRERANAINQKFMADRALGLYCPTCGRTYPGALKGDVTECASCGLNRLLPYTQEPRRYWCSLPGCPHMGWYDSVDHSAKARHMREAHPRLRQ